MKSTLLFVFTCFSLLVAGCSSVSSTVSGDNRIRPEGSVSDDMNYFTSLADYLRRVPGVHISGSGEVTVRGLNNFDGIVSPLFVIDGNAVGYSYHKANNMVDSHFIDYVQVLKGPEATIYGIRGGNGVIEIVTKKI